MALMGNAKEVMEYLHLDKDSEDRKGTVNMCKALEDMKEMSRMEGQREGGICTLVRDNLDEGTSTERIIMKLNKYFSLTEEQSLQYIERYSAETV